MSIRITGTGIKVEVKHRFNGQIPPQVKGEHLWVVAALWRVTPTTKEFHLDTENLLTVDGCGCYWCGELWYPGISAVCDGKFKDD